MVCMKIDSLDPNSTYTERDLLALGFDRKILSEIRSNLWGYGIEGEEILGAWVLNYALRNDGNQTGRYVNAFVFSESTGIPYSDVLRRQYNKRQLSVEIGSNGSTDLMINVFDLHLFYQGVEERDALTTTVIEYQDRRTRESLDKVFEEAEPFVRSLINVWMNKLGQHLTQDQIRSSIYKGLLDSVEAFERDRGFNFTTLAGNRCRGAILDDIREYDTVSRRNRGLSKKIDRIIEAFIREHNMSPTYPEIVEASGLTGQQFVELNTELRLSQAISLSNKSSRRFQENGEQLYMRDLVKDKQTVMPLDELISAEVENTIRRVLRSFGQRDARVFDLYFFDQLTMAEIGEQLGISETRVCQVLGNSDYLERLRNAVGIDAPEKVRILRM